MINESVHTLEEIAEIANLHINTVRKMCRDGRIIAKKIGRQWFVGKEGLAALLPK